VKSNIVKRSVVVDGHKTSVSLEEAFWNGMKRVVAERGIAVSELIREIDTERKQANLSSAIRLFLLGYYRSRAVAMGDQPKQPGYSLNGR